MNTKTLLHLNYLNRVFLLVNQENYDDYSLHQKVGNEIERKTFKELDGHPKERLAAYLITVARYHLFLEKQATGKTEEELKWDESYVQLVQFIDTLIPGYSYRLAYLQRADLQKQEEYWVSTYTVYAVNDNQLQEKKPAFRIVQSKQEIKVEWVITEEHLLKHYPQFEQIFTKIKEDETLSYQQETNPKMPPLFEGFEDLFD